MAMKYQKGTAYPRGQKVKMWYGKYLIYAKDKQGKEVRRHRNVAIRPKANTPKWKAEQKLQEIITDACFGARSSACSAAGHEGRKTISPEEVPHAHGRMPRDDLILGNSHVYSFSR